MVLAKIIIAMDKFQSNNFIERVADLLPFIPDSQFADAQSFIPQITHRKKRVLHGTMHPLEASLRLHCYLTLYCSRLPDQQLDTLTSKKVSLEAAVCNFLREDDQSVFLLFGKPGSGKSLFLFKHFQMMSKPFSSAAATHRIPKPRHHLEGPWLRNTPPALDYQYTCRFYPLGKYQKDEAWKSLAQEIRGALK